MRFLRTLAQILLYAVAFDLATALIGGLLIAASAWWSMPMTTRLLGWTGFPPDKQPTPLFGFVFALQPAPMGGAWVAAVCTARLGRWRFLLAAMMLVHPFLSLLGLIDFLEVRLSPRPWQLDPTLLGLAETQALVLCIALSTPGVLLATWHAILLQERRYQRRADGADRCAPSPQGSTDNPSGGEEPE